MCIITQRIYKMRDREERGESGERTQGDSEDGEKEGVRRGEKTDQVLHTSV